MADHKKRNPTRDFWLVLAMSAVLLALLPSLYRQQTGQLAEQYRQDLKALPDEEVAEFVNRLVATDGLGLPILIEGLDSRRESVRSACRRALLGRCSGADARIEADATFLASLAEQLAEHSPKFGRHGRGAAAELAFELLSSPGFQHVDGPRMLLACEEILRQVNRMSKFSDADGSAIAAQSRSFDAAGGARSRKVVLASTTSEPSSPEAAVRHAIVEDVHSPAVPAAAIEPEEPVSLDLPEEEPLPLNSDVHVVGPVDTPRLLPTVVAKAKPLVPSDVPAGDAPPLAAANVAVAAALTPEEAERLGTIELAQLLKRPDVAAMAEAELAQRGFTGMYLEVAQRLTDPDPSVRLRWTEALPGLTELDVRPWLLWLCRDEDAEVRLTAITLLATTSDPALLREVREISARDSDPRIQRLAQQLAGDRGQGSGIGGQGSGGAGRSGKAARQ